MGRESAGCQAGGSGRKGRRRERSTGGGRRLLLYPSSGLLSLREGRAEQDLGERRGQMTPSHPPSMGPRRLPTPLARPLAGQCVARRSISERLGREGGPLTDPWCRQPPPGVQAVRGAALHDESSPVRRGDPARRWQKIWRACLQIIGAITGAQLSSISLGI